MKKFGIGFLLIVLIFCICYFALSSSKAFSVSETAKCVEPAVARQINQKQNWKLWWPGVIKNDSIFYFQDCKYKIDKILLNGFQTTLFLNQDSLKGFLQYIYIGNDSTTFQWTSTALLPNGPLARFNKYFKLRKIELSIANLLKAIKIHFDNQEKVYGLKINRETVSESSYISTKNTFNHYPSTLEVYDMINALKQYINLKGGTEKMYPMLHVEYEGPAIYETMVAIPTKTPLPSTDRFQLKKMILGNILTAEVKGGTYRVIAGEEEFKNFINDYKTLSPAIPFQSLITDRIIEKDTTKWITKLNYPIFQ